jgi:transcriptional regulator with XRE-family HTH domain
LFLRNLKYLRNKKKITQTNLARLLEVSRQTIQGYENGKAEPVISILQKICDYFEISVQQIIEVDLSNTREEEEEKEIALKNKNIRVIAISKDLSEQQNIELVPIHATAGYALNFSNASFIESLQAFSIPKLNEGTYRAFEIQGKSMLPISEGSIIVSKYVEHINYLKNNKRYILILKDEGIVFKRVVKDKEMANRVILFSDNPEYQPFTTHLSNILELWEMVATIEYGDEITDISEMLMTKMNALEQKINQVIYTKN